MTARCALCARRLRRPSPDGYGPRCRRKLRPVRTAGGADVVPGAGIRRAHAVPPQQLTLPRPPYPGDATWRGRTIHTIPTGDLT